MAYDEMLAERIRDALGPARADAIEKKMFGGLAFLIGGNMAVAASRKGGLLVRVDPDEATELLHRESVENMIMGGREVRGWLYVGNDVVDDDTVLNEWVERSVAFARTLPTK